MGRIILVSIILFFALQSTSCSTIVNATYGLKPVKPVDDKTIGVYSKKYGIPAADSYKLDTSYNSFLSSMGGNYKARQQNHYQPLQALYYNKTGALESFQINCYAGGAVNLNWNRSGILTTFPPKQQAPLDSLVPLPVQLKFLLPLPETKSFSEESYDYIVVVYWSRFMGRQSQRFIHYIQENATLAADKKVKMIYVNNDNLFAQ